MADIDIPPTDRLYPVLGFPGYFVNGLGIVFSARFREIQIYTTSNGALFVRLLNQKGRRPSVRIRKLLRVHGIDFEDWMKDTIVESGRAKRPS